MVRWLGAAYLLTYGGMSLRRAARPSSLRADGRIALGRRTAILTTLALTFLNPHVYLDTVVMIGSVANGYGDNRWQFAAGAALGSVLWFSGLGIRRPRRVIRAEPVAHLACARPRHRVRHDCARRTTRARLADLRRRQHLVEIIPGLGAAGARENQLVRRAVVRRDHECAGVAFTVRSTAAAATFRSNGPNRIGVEVEIGERDRQGAVAHPFRDRVHRRRVRCGSAHTSTVDRTVLAPPPSDDVRGVHLLPAPRRVEGEIAVHDRRTGREHDDIAATVSTP